MISRIIHMASIAEIITHLHKQNPALRVRGSADHHASKIPWGGYVPLTH
jgi:hypothetical protein